MKINLLNLIFFNRTPSRLEARLVYKHTQKRDLLIEAAFFREFVGILQTPPYVHTLAGALFWFLPPATLSTGKTLSLTS